MFSVTTTVASGNLAVGQQPHGGGALFAAAHQRQHGQPAALRTAIRPALWTSYFVVRTPLRIELRRRRRLRPVTVSRHPRASVYRHPRCRSTRTDRPAASARRRLDLCLQASLPGSRRSTKRDRAVARTSGPCRRLVNRQLDRQRPACRPPAVAPATQHGPLRSAAATEQSGNVTPTINSRMAMTLAMTMKPPSVITQRASGLGVLRRPSRFANG